MTIILLAQDRFTTLLLVMGSSHWVRGTGVCAQQVSLAKAGVCAGITAGGDAALFGDNKKIR